MPDFGSLLLLGLILLITGGILLLLASKVPDSEKKTYNFFAVIFLVFGVILVGIPAIVVGLILVGVVAVLLNGF